MSRDIKNLGPDLLKAIVKESNRITLDMGDKLTRTTPVDTGFAAASWIPSVASPAKGVGGAPGSPNTAAASAGQAQVATNTNLTTLHVTNNVSYIQKLNDGHSEQQPALFIERAIKSTVEEANRRNIR